MTPARDTVGGLALAWFSGSEQHLTVGDMEMRPPLASVSTLSSSSTMLRFSIKVASTGPSQMIQLWRDLSLLALRH